MPAPFRVGDRVHTAHRTGGIVISVDSRANHGLGSVVVRFPDGVELGGPFVGSGFERSP